MEMKAANIPCQGPPKLLVFVLVGEISANQGEKAPSMI